MDFFSRRIIFWSQAGLLSKHFWGELSSNSRDAELLSFLLCLYFPMWFFLFRKAFSKSTFFYDFLHYFYLLCSKNGKIAFSYLNNFNSFFIRFICRMFFVRRNATASLPLKILTTIFFYFSVKKMNYFLNILPDSYICVPSCQLRNVVKLSIGSAITV